MKKETKRKVLKLPAKASLYYLFANAAAKAVGVISTPIFTRLLSGEGYGEYTLYISRLAFLSVTLSAIPCGVQSYKEMSRSKDDQDGYVSSLLGISLAFCAIICILLFTFKAVFGLNNFMIIIFTLQLVCDGILYVGNMRAKYFYSYKEVFFTSLVQSVLSVLLAAILIRGASLGYEARIWGLFIASVIVSAPVLSKILSKCPVLFSKNTYKRVIRRLVPVFPHALSGALSMQIDRFIISAALGTVALAKYSVAHSLAAALSMLTGAASSALCPWIMRKLNAKETDTVSAISLDCSILLAASIVAVVTVAPEAMSILAPKSYSDATVAVLPIALSALPTFIYSLGCTVLIHRGFGARVSACALISSLCAVVLGFIFIPKFSYFGAGLAHLLAQTAAAVTVLIIMLGSGEKLFSATKICVIFVVTTSFAILARASVGQVALRILILISSVSLIALKLFRMRSLISEK